MFSGPRRKGDVHKFLQALGGREGVDIRVEGLDLVIAQKQNMMDTQFFAHMVLRFTRSEIQILSGFPPCGTWSKAHFQKGGPRLIRSRLAPWVA